MPPKVQQKSKEAKMAAAMAGGKSKKKKWQGARQGRQQGALRRGHVRAPARGDPEDEAYHAFGAAPGLETEQALVERLKVNGALARAAIKELEGKGLIKMVEHNHVQWIYTRDVGSD